MLSRRSLTTQKAETRSQSSSASESTLPDLDSLSNLPEEQQQEIYALTAAVDYDFYVEYVHRGFYVHGDHTKYICQALHEVEKGSLKRLMIFLPPRHSKSFTVSETFPSWFIGRKPSRRVIIVSYGDSLARRFGKANRTKVSDFGPSVFGIQLDQGGAPVTNWGLESHRGQMISTGIGGPIAGEGADLLIIDDPIKNSQEANSPTYREMIWNEWRNTLLTRLSPEAVVILIQTRWHEDDLAGRILREEKDKWAVLKLPCQAEEGDPLGRSLGEPLWPEYGFDKAWSDQRKIEVGSYAWAALYQQRPAPLEGGIIKRHWWRYYQEPPSDFDEVFQSWDMAFKDTKSSSYVVGQVWGRKGADGYLLDQVRDRMNFVETLRAVQALSTKWPEAIGKIIEDKANGPAVIESLKESVGGLIPEVPSGSKIARTFAVSPLIEAGNVYLPANAPWLGDYLDELTAFPNAMHDDQVDATTQALKKITRRTRPSIRIRGAGG